jgi:hypothetical protein
MLTAAGLLVLALGCGASAVAIHQRVVAPPRLNVELGGYRIVTSPVTIRSNPPKYYYSVWLFTISYTPNGLRTEKGQQVLLLRLRAD